jgi:NADH dehydrogenase FAD-containing subunit
VRSVAPADKAGRLIVGDDLRVPGLANVFAIGDTAASKAWKGETVPGLAASAKRSVIENPFGSMADESLCWPFDND